MFLWVGKFTLAPLQENYTKVYITFLIKQLIKLNLTIKAVT